VPFGEVFIEERNNTWNTPYLFNAKELDEETGLYYYGARYYDARISLWLSTDPLQEKYPNISTYAYTFQNPIRYIDPSGMEGGEPEPFVNKDKSRIVAKDGVIQLKLENFNPSTRQKIKAMSQDPNCWSRNKYNPYQTDLGLSLEVGELDWTNLTEVPRSELVSMDNTVGAVDPSYDPRVIPIKGTVLRKDGQPNRNFAGWNQVSIYGGSESFVTGSRGLIAINIINFGVEQYIFWTAIDDREKFREHVSLIYSAIQVVNTASKIGMIPDKYQNRKDLTDILNVVFQGENTTGNKRIEEIGMKILKSKNYLQGLNKK
jgi:RHS repeat-associated protein